MEKSNPEIILSAAVSIDGKIATVTGNSTLSSHTDMKRVHKLRSTVDAIIIGKNTLNQDNPLLTVRHVPGKNPTRIIIDSKGTISPKSKIIQTAHKVSTIIVTTEKISKKNYLRLINNSIEVIISGKNHVSLKRLMSELYKRDIKSVLLEGGGITNWEFFKHDLVNKIIVTITPYILGGSKTVSLVEGSGFTKILSSPKFTLKKVTRIGDELVLYYKKL